MENKEVKKDDKNTDPKERFTTLRTFAQARIVQALSRVNVMGEGMRREMLAYFFTEVGAAFMDVGTAVRTAIDQNVTDLSRLVIPPLEQGPDLRITRVKLCPAGTCPACDVVRFTGTIDRAAFDEEHKNKN